MYCPNCGEEIKSEEQKYCEQCGAELPERKPEPVQSQEQDESVVQKGGLFDLSRKMYVLREKYWDFGSGDIYDKEGKIIGKMDRKFFDFRRTIKLREVDGTVAATIHEKIISIQGENILLDAQGNLIARFKKKITSFFHPKFWLEDPNGTRWYEAIGEFMGWSFGIREIATGKTVAEIEKADRWRDIFLGGFFDFQDTYALRILDNETDRRILVGFVLSIDNVLHDNRHGMGYRFPWGLGPFPPGRMPWPRRIPPGRRPWPARWPF